MALKRRGAVVGFLGDGVNDASALHAADVGISVDSGADVAKAAADLVLMQRDLTVINEGVIEGRRTVKNVTKYILMGSSSNFGNMFSMAGAALFLPFLPMLPVQVLLNNLLYDVSEMGVPFDRVDASALARPVRWSTTLIERFMLVFGPVSSLFDFLTFFVLLRLFGADAAQFQTGWFVESLATQALVVFVIRTRGLLALPSASDSDHPFDRRGGGWPNRSLDADRDLVRAGASAVLVLSVSGRGGGGLSGAGGGSEAAVLSIHCPSVSGNGLHPSGH